MVTTATLNCLVDGKLSIIALYPGGTTGWALYTADVIHNLADERPRPEFYNGKFDAGQIGPGPHHRRLWGFLEQWTVINTIIVCESFEFRRNERDRNRTNIVLDSKEYIGVVNLYQQLYDHRANLNRGNHSRMKTVYQTAATGKGFWTDEKLKAVNKFSTPKTRWPHANDAMRHLLHYMSFKMDRKDLLLPLRGK